MLWVGGFSPDMQPAPKSAMSGLKPPTYEMTWAHISNFNE